ncbi:calpain-13 [Monodelphis domestica]|uniref:calpain-13 n=1 Tax=Monodelphis domestica TaxID=13616 RepID=UPI0024E23BF5|nr:calpain-13 [Monodelphis domestica]
MFHNQIRSSYSNTMDNVIRFQNQDFTSLRDHCLRNGMLFEDDMFPADDSAIGHKLLREKNLSSPIWYRPKELSEIESHHFILDGISKFDIQQGLTVLESRFIFLCLLTGDCWFLAALGSLTQRPKLLAKIIPPNQSFKQGYAGIFHFQFWQCGQWVDVVVDDRLPVKPYGGANSRVVTLKRREYLFVHPRGGNNEFWPCLLEKAYAKLHGSYSNLHSGSLADSLVELTGWIVTAIDLKKADLNMVQNLKVAEQCGSIITCGIENGLDVEQFGLVNNHAYAVTGTAEVHLGTGREELIRLWNPWGWGCEEWLGRWSDKSEEWWKIQDSERTRLYSNKADGEFWMSFQDFQMKFSHIYICYQEPMELNNGDLTNGTWIQIPCKIQKIQENINPGGSSGSLPFRLHYSPESECFLPVSTHTPRNTVDSDESDAVSMHSCYNELTGPGSRCRDALRNTWQCPFSVTEPMEGVNVVVSMNIQPNQNISMMPLFEIYKDHKLQNPAYFKVSPQSVQKKIIKSKWNYTESIHLVPGNYIVVPITTNARELRFFLRIFLKQPDINNVNRNLQGCFESMRIKENLPGIMYHETIFYRYAQGLDIGASQLQSLLNKELLKSNASENRERKFTFDECRSILALMDVKVNGRLDLEEFEQLWKKLIRCQSIFQKVEKNASGFLLGSDLWKVIQEAGLFLDTSNNSELLDLMAIRYGDGTGKIYFSDLVCLLIRLEIVSKAFHNLARDGRIYLTKTEWLKFNMYC